MATPEDHVVSGLREAARRGAARGLGVSLLVAALLLVVVAWWLLGGMEGAPPAMTDAQAQDRIAVLAEKFDAALQNDRDASALMPEVQRLTEAFPQIAGGHQLLGQLHSHRGAFEPALVSFDLALSLKPDNAQLHLLAGGMSEQLGDLSVAERHYRAAQDNEADEPEHRVRLANVAIKTGRWEEAEALLQSALGADVTLHEAHALMASVLENQGQSDAALGSMERSYEFVQNEGGERLRKYSLRLARMLRERDRPALAAKVLRLPKPEDFFVAEVMSAHAEALDAAGLPFEAGQYYEQWVRRDPVNAEAAAASARWYLRAKERGPAHAMLVVLRRIDPRHAELPALEKRLLALPRD